jgi:hypothetical protein
MNLDHKRTKTFKFYAEIIPTENLVEHYLWKWWTAEQFSSLCLTGLRETITAFMEGDSHISDAILDNYWRIIQYLPRECSSNHGMKIRLVQCLLKFHSAERLRIICHCILQQNGYWLKFFENLDNCISWKRQKHSSETTDDWLLFI